MKWYRVKHWSRGRFGDIRIEPIDIDKETAKMVFWTNEHGREERAYKSSEDYTWCSSKDDAVKLATGMVKELIKIMKARVRQGQANLEWIREFDSG